ncbi:MAG: fatty acid oxidation complex subunit alpha FadJ [Gemmatimonadetes bacterium]|nr:fatty acid oxidation complex subunit alpha FadJ [Gemmatimonadota bacterium]
MSDAALRLTVADGIARLVLDLPGEPVNKITRGVRGEIEAMLTRLQNDNAVRAVVLISGKPDTFIAGADIEEFVALTSAAAAEALVRDGQKLVSRFGEIGKPVVAAIHGACLGGGLESALACTYRVATDHPKTTLGLPEVQLGIIPAAGGCQRLPRLIGVRAALDIILAGKTVPASRAFRMSMVDELVHPSILETVAVAAARRLADGWKRPRRRQGVMGWLLEGNPIGRWVVFGAAGRQVTAKSGGHYPAPLAALDAVRHGLSQGIPAGLEREAVAFGRLAVGDVSRKLVQIFFATTSLKKDPGVPAPAPEPRAVSRLAVIGAGFMGAAIAGVAVAQGHVDARVRDTDLARVAKGLEAARRILQDRLKRRRITKYEFPREDGLLSGGTDWAGFGDTDLVIEAVFEDLAVKHKVFAEIEAQVGSECVVASNTSTIPITRIAQGAKHPERVIGMHFFSPVDRMPLLEVIAGEQTAPWAVVTAVAFGRRIGKTVIVVRDRPGFWVNRVLAPYIAEAGRLIAEGVSVEHIDKVAVRFGFPVGPVTLMDEVGIDVVHKASAVMHQAFGDRLAPLDGIARMVTEGRLGRKSGRGFYRYADGKKQGPDPESAKLFGGWLGARPSAEVVFDRLVYALLNEAAMALDEGVVRSPRDGDIAAIFGFGFPPFRGGPLRYADDLGAARVVETLDRLKQEHGNRFEAAPSLRRMAKTGGTFYGDARR